MWLIPGKTKVQTEIFKGVSLADILIGVIAGAVLIFLLASNLPYKFIISVVLLFITALLLIRIDTEPNYVLLFHLLHYLGYPKRYERIYSDRLLLNKQQEGGRKEELDKVYAEDHQKTEETKAQKQQRKKQEKAERREDDRKLKDKKVSKEEKDAIWKKRAAQNAERSRKKREAKEENRSWKNMEELLGFTQIKDGLIHYHGQYYGAVIEIPPVEFRFFSQFRRINSIQNSLGRIFRSIGFEYATNIVKIERAIQYDSYREKEYGKLEELRAAYEKGMLTEEELKARVEILYDRINELERLNEGDPVVVPFYYLVLFDSDKGQLEHQVKTALDTLRQGELDPKRLNDREIAIFLKYTNQLDFDEKEIDKIEPENYAVWAMPELVAVRPRTIEVNNIITHNMRIVGYPMLVEDAWLASLMSIPSTKVVVKCKPVERAKAIRSIDRSLAELRGQYNMTGIDSKAMELQGHIESLSELLMTLQNDNEILLNVNIYVTSYDISATRNSPNIVHQPPISSRSVIANMKKAVRRMYQEEGMRMNNMELEQLMAFIGSQINGYDPFGKKGRGMPSNTVAASYPWVFAHVADPGGIKLGSSDNVPVFIDFFRRDSERVNSNMVIIGKSGSGKSYATKSLLANLAADDAKIFILDPENEYSELAENLHGKFINVGNAQHGRLNPFHIITSLDDDEADGDTMSGSYATHLQFLEEFFRQILPDCEKDAMEYLNSMIDRMYTNMGITAETDLSKLAPEDYPIFDDLYDEILREFQQTDNEYIRRMLRTLMNYIAKFSTGGRNANIWNGPSTITTDENFSVFNFQSLLSNRNSTIANAQMLLVLKYIDNEIIKNREYNLKNKMSRKVVVVIDEAHVFIDEKFPIALDFMFQLAKRIRKYNGMQIVITQNIKDFVGTEEIARKSTAIMNACQYSFIFSLAPNDMTDLCRLYEKAGGINENEQEQIMSAPRGQAFTVMSPSSRSTFKVEVPSDIVEMFQDYGYESSYFSGEEGEKNWERFLGDSREKHEMMTRERIVEEEEQKAEKERRQFVTFREITEEEAGAFQTEQEQKLQKKETKVQQDLLFSEDSWDIPEDPEEFQQMLEQKKKQIPASEAVQEVSRPASLQTQEPGQAASSEPSKVEQMLTEFIGKFSYDAMLEEIRRTVREELLLEMEKKKTEEQAQFLGRQQRMEASAFYKMQPEMAAVGNAEKDSVSFEEMESDMEAVKAIKPETVSLEDAEPETAVVEDTEPDQVPLEEAELETAVSEDTKPEPDRQHSLDEEEERIFAEIFGTAYREETEETMDTEEETGAPAAEADRGTMEESTKEDEEAEDIFEALFGEPVQDTKDGEGKTDSEDGFDIFSFLDEQVSMESQVSFLEKMEMYDETVQDITLEELSLYNRNMRKSA